MNAETEPQQPPPSRLHAFPNVIVSMVGALLWFWAWDLIEGGDWIDERGTLLVPLILGVVINGINAFVQLFEALTDDRRLPGPDSLGHEIALIEFVERHAAHIVAGVAGLFLISVTIAAQQEGEGLSVDFVRFEVAALVCAVGGVLPIYWISRPKGLAFVRHVKTVLFSYAVCFFLAGLLFLLGGDAASGKSGSDLRSQESTETTEPAPTKQGQRESPRMK